MKTEPLFEESEFNKRNQNLLEISKDVDVSIIFNRADLFYYSGFGMDGMMISDPNKNSNQRYVTRNLKLAEELSSLPTEKMSSFRIFKELDFGHKIDKIGLELDILPQKTVDYISKAFDCPELIDISYGLRKIRSVKSLKEQEYLKQACEQTDQSFEYISDKIKPGVTELELSANIELNLRLAGHPGWVQVRKFNHNYSSPAHVMAGESTRSLNSMFGPVSGLGICRYHMNGPSKRKIKEGDAVLIDTTGVVEGYTADETRTFFVGNVDQKFKEAYELCKDIQKKIETIMIAGKYPKEIYNIVLNMVEESDFSDNFMGIYDDKVQFLGHGIGLELDEFPIITPNFNEKLVEGQIVAIEPKIILDNPIGGVGIEDSWIVGSSRSTKITHFEW